MLQAPTHRRYEDWQALKTRVRRWSESLDKSPGTYSTHDDGSSDWRMKSRICSRGSPQSSMDEDGESAVVSIPSPPSSWSAPSPLSTLVRSTRPHSMTGPARELNCERHCLSTTRLPGASWCSKVLAVLAVPVRAPKRRRCRWRGVWSGDIADRSSPALAIGDASGVRAVPGAGRLRGDHSRALAAEDEDEGGGAAGERAGRVGSWSSVSLARLACSICWTIHPSRRSCCMCEMMTRGLGGERTEALGQRPGGDNGGAREEERGKNSRGLSS
jgi:hypothetical protein